MNSVRTILVSGASGLVGRPLCEALEKSGHQVRRLSRSKGDYLWAPERGEIDGAALDGVDTVVHLAGETVAQRWTPAAKERILSSRVKGAELLVREILRQGRPIDYVSASGISYYGVDSAEPKDESHPLGDGFLASVTKDWESAASPLKDAGLRCVFVRTGVVLAKEGGALKKLLPPFRAGLGGRVGNGRQMMSWISLADLVRIFVRAVEDTAFEGPVNGVGPQAVTNREFTKALGKVLSRPTFFPLPGTVVSTLFGDMGRETILSNLNVTPKILSEAGFEWQHSDIGAALEHTINS